MSEKELDEEYYKQFIGMNIGKGRYRVKGRNLSNYADAVGAHNPKYYVLKPEGDEKPDYSGIVAHPAYASVYTVPGILTGLPDVEDSEGNKLCINIGKLLHTKQEYNYDGCVPLTPNTTKVFTKGTFKKLWFKGGMLWVEIEMITSNRDETEIYCKTMLGGILRKGGYREVYKDA